MNESAEYQMFEALDAAVTGRMMDQEMADAIADIIIESILEKDSRDKPRPTVAAFALLMEAELRKHDDRPGWEGCDIDWLMGRLREEVNELGLAVFNDDESIPQEAADVANFAMMIADVSGALRAGGDEAVKLTGGLTTAPVAPSPGSSSSEAVFARDRIECWLSEIDDAKWGKDDDIALDIVDRALSESSGDKPAPSPGPLATCPVCHGTGENKDAKQAWDIPEAPAPECEFCFGTGEVNAVPAPSPDPSRSSTAEQAPYKGQVAGSIPAGTTSPLPAEVEEAMGRMEGAVKDCYASMKVGWYGTADEMYRLDQAALAVIKSALSKPAPLPSPSVEEPIQIVFDGPPAHEAGRFVEVEQGGRSINFGEWKQREDGYWVLEFPREAALSAKEKS